MDQNKFYIIQIMKALLPDVILSDTRGYTENYIGNDKVHVKVILKKIPYWDLIEKINGLWEEGRSSALETLCLLLNEGYSRHFVGMTAANIISRKKHSDETFFGFIEQINSYVADEEKLWKLLSE